MTRRQLVLSSAAACAALTRTRRAAWAAPPPPPARSQIRITDIKTFLLWSGGERNIVIVKVETDQGLVGIGEAYACGPDEATVKVIEDYKRWLAGHDPRNVEHLWSLMHNFTRFPGGFVVNAAISGIEHALWDIAAKAVGLPVYMLLGGKCRDRIRMYRGIHAKKGLDSGYMVGLEDSARENIAKYGYTAFKTLPLGINSKPDNQLVRDFGAKFRKLREAVGPDVGLGVDVHAQFFQVSRAIRLAKEIEPVNPMWMEESIRPENAKAMAKLAQHVDIPLAGGEANYTKYEFQEILALGALDIVQPDLCLVGGLLGGKKIAALAEAHYVSVAPHNPSGPLATAIAVHFAASTPNFSILEGTPDDGKVRKDILKSPLKVVKGHIELPTAPGFGVELNEEAFKHFPGRPWHRPFQFRPDGAVGWI